MKILGVLDDVDQCKHMNPAEEAAQAPATLSNLEEEEDPWLFHFTFRVLCSRCARKLSCPPRACGGVL